jgi:hypothetical protein
MLSLSSQPTRLRGFGCGLRRDFLWPWLHTSLSMTARCAVVIIRASEPPSAASRQPLVALDSLDFLTGLMEPDP